MKLFDELNARGLVQATTSPELPGLLDRPQTVYCGFDPSARSLQAGNLVSIMVLRRFQRAGHRVLALVGGATGLIGDPSGKSAERNMLSRAQVEENKRAIRENLSRFLDFSGPNPAILVDNYDWYKSMSAIEFLRDVAVNFRVPQMLAKESVKKRLEAREGALTFTEFAYQVLQGYDFLHLYDTYGCTIEIGGADQWGNITAGTDLVRRMRGKEVHGLVFPLLLDGAGRKFGKSEGNALFLDKTMTSVYDWYQYFIRTADADAGRYLKVFSSRGLDEIAALEEAMRKDPGARIPQKALADELTALVHGEDALRAAREATEAMFGKASGDAGPASAAELEAAFKDVKSGQLPRADVEGKCVWAVAAAAGMFKSNGEARRMAAQGGLSLNGEKVSVDRAFAAEDLVDGRLAVLRQGKKNNFLLRVQ